MENESGSTPGAGETEGSPANSPAPATALEEAIQAGQAGEISNQDVIAAIWNADLLSVGRLTAEDDPASFQALVLKSPKAQPRLRQRSRTPSAFRSASATQPRSW